MADLLFHSLTIPLAQTAHGHFDCTFRHPHFGRQSSVGLRLAVADEAGFERAEQRLLAVTCVVRAVD